MTNPIASEIADYLAEGRYGPAMTALPNDRQRAFVIACTQPDADGGVDYARAARAAGYGTPTSSSESLRTAGSRLAHSAPIQAAMLEEAQGRLGAAVPMATARLVQIMTQSTKEVNQMKAASMILNRGGLPERTEHNVIVTKTETQQERLERAIRLAKELGLDPKTLLGNIGISLQTEPAVAISAPALNDDWLR